MLTAKAERSETSVGEKMLTCVKNEWNEESFNPTYNESVVFPM